MVVSEELVVKAVCVRSGNGEAGVSDVIFTDTFTGICNTVLSGCVHPDRTTRKSTSTVIPGFPRNGISGIFLQGVLIMQVLTILPLYMGRRENR